MITKEFCIEKYNEFKKRFRKIPKYKEYCNYAGIRAARVEEIFGRSAFSKLQVEAGDKASKLSLVRTPLDQIMRQYGDLANELGELPFASDWRQGKLRPTEDGLRVVHKITWSQMPLKFKEWVEGERVAGYENVLRLIKQKSKLSSTDTPNGSPEFRKLINDVRQWAPARGRNSEEAYKIELRLSLKNDSGYDVGEERGDSNVDLLVNKKHAVEIKKAQPKVNMTGSLGS